MNCLLSRSATLLTVLAIPALVRADQVVITDVTYTHSADTTSDSHYRVKPDAGAPADWTNPVDYTKGSVHVLLDVKTKPAGDTPTKFQICFEGTPDYACTAQAPTYTKTGKYDWDTNFADLWYGGDVDWSKGVKQVALILKDTNNGKPQGDPKYVPSDLRVQVTLVSAGAKFVPPGEAGAGGAPAAGSGGQGGRAGGGGAGRSAGGSGGSAAGRGGAVAAGSGGAAAGSGGRAAPIDAGVPASAGTSSAPVPVAGSAGRAAGSAGSGAAGTAASGATGTTTSPVETAGTAATTPPAKDDSGCNTTGQSGSSSAALVIASLFLLQRRKRRAAS